MEHWYTKVVQSCSLDNSDTTMDLLTRCTGAIDSLLWNNMLTLGLFLLTGLFLTLRMGFIQIRGFKHAIQLVRGKHDDPEHEGEVNHFEALSTALSATVGTGNIAGVATAISLGGPGALFWMWMTAFFGMATKFTSCTLAVKFRHIEPNGDIAGGPMYTLLNALNMRITAIIFAIFAVIASFGIGNLVQANSVVDGISYLVPFMKTDEGQFLKFGLGIIMATFVGLVIIGGVKRIARIASYLVPFMTIIYIFAAVIVLFNHLSDIPAAFSTIFYYAFNPYSIGGAVMGEAVRWGVARGVFSNEAGLGSSPIAHAAAKTNEPVREGLVAMLEPFIDTIIVCTLTGLVIIVSGVYLDRPDDLVGSSLTASAFSETLNDFGGYVVGFGLSLFAFSTMVAWSYYGDRAIKFLFGEVAVLPYRVVFVFFIIIGASVKLELVWNIADITNLLMAIPNIISLLLLATFVKKLSEQYFANPNHLTAN
ncbi:Sodium/glycine symporter GlyP [hydrothermal vent metagenome]|uniref:Sodium/glycine symporter GlyP n=1 Tax=hydrothermal vent metagenome TaxID=652676 RepID=A0A3B1AWM5_9ZZZZ